jgi:hypothetical protein
MITLALIFSGAAIGLGLFVVLLACLHVRRDPMMQPWPEPETEVEVQEFPALGRFVDLRS